MIKNFEEQTVELTAEEQKFAWIIVQRFNTKKGKQHIVTADAIIDGLKNHFDVEFKESRIRKMIQYIRLNNLVVGLIATSKGYYVADSIEEIEDWINSLKSRENAIRSIRELAERQIELMKIANQPVQTTFEF
jgi:DNA-directed RNA polymerase specialized sigma54-like protein